MGSDVHLPRHYRRWDQTVTLMRIRDIFRNDIARRIEEVVKVDNDDDVIVASEISEYVVTERIAEYLHDVVEVYRETIGNPDGRTNLWISGFFGSGKSSFAKVLGYLLENRRIGDRRPSSCSRPAATTNASTPFWMRRGIWRRP